MSTPLEKNISTIDAATQTARFLAEHGGPVGFCDNPDDLTSAGGMQLETVAIISGNRSKMKIEKNKKPARGSALIVQRTMPDGSSDFQILPNDSKIKEAPYRFNLASAREIFSGELYAQVLQAIHKNLEHRRAHLFPTQRTVYRRGSK